MRALAILTPIARDSNHINQDQKDKLARWWKNVNFLLNNSTGESREQLEERMNKRKLDHG